MANAQVSRSTFIPNHQVHQDSDVVCVSPVCVLDHSANWLQVSAHEFSDCSWFIYKLGGVGSQEPVKGSSVLASSPAVNPDDPGGKQAAL